MLKSIVILILLATTSFATAVSPPLIEWQKTNIGSKAGITNNIQQIATNITVVGEANVTNILDYGEYNHTFILFVQDQEGNPVNNTMINFTFSYYPSLLFQIGNVTTNASGLAEIPLTSTEMVLAGGRASINDTIFVLMKKTWVWLNPLPAFIYPVGPSWVTNYYDLGEVNHTFALQVSDSLFPMANISINYTINYSSSGIVMGTTITNETGIALIPVSSDINNTAYITACVENLTYSLCTHMIKVWIHSPIPVPGYSNPPTDTDKDKLYEDLNANGRKDFADVVLYFQQMEWIAANEPLEAFDFNINSRIDFNDIVRLFEEI